MILKKLKLPFLLYAGFVCMYPFLLSSEYYHSVGTIVGLYAIVTIGLCLVMGLSGQISLGQAAFWGIGAYTSAILSGKYGLPVGLSLFCAALVPAAVAFLMARAIAGLQGYYLAMATLAVGYIVQILIVEWEPVTGGASGIIGIPSIPLFGENELSMYYFVWGIVTIVLVFSLNILHSRIGRAYRAIHKSEVAATSMGVHVRSYKLSAFIISGLFAGISGGLYGHYVGILDPQPFGLHESIKFLTMVVIGGMASIWGALVGTVIIVAISEVLIVLGEHISGLQGDVDTIVFGAILILCIIFMPEGLVPRIQLLLEKFIAGRKNNLQKPGGAEEIKEQQVRKEMGA
ncbi:branched-chain amino acid ABC transporter permease [Aneurinibacillus sp. REN35]|uniref:branched-chain amino acid ABC transporter permease n=1 Tax=Aneurinibacillus sp. REN35 TaxID=3237286 RepID=UPI00352776F3